MDGYNDVRIDTTLLNHGTVIIVTSTCSLKFSHLDLPQLRPLSMLDNEPVIVGILPSRR